MTRSIVVLLLLLSLMLATTAHASDEVSGIDVCRDFSIIAKDIMTARHKNKPMSEALPIAIDRIKDWMDKYGFEVFSEEAEEWAEALVIDAYDGPVFPSSSTFNESRREEISEFENGHFEECYKGLTSDSEE